MSDMPTHSRSALKSAHAHCTANEDCLKASELAGCFHCCQTYSPAEIREWVRERDDRRTAVCPRCGIDSVIGSNSGITLSDEFLRAMESYWFADCQ